MIGFGGAQHAWSRSDRHINVLYFDSMTCENKKVGFVELEKGILFVWYSRGPFSPYNNNQLFLFIDMGYYRITATQKNGLIYNQSLVRCQDNIKTLKTCFVKIWPPFPKAVAHKNSQSLKVTKCIPIGVQLHRSRHKNGARSEKGSRQRAKPFCHVTWLWAHEKDHPQGDPNFTQQ